MDFILDRIRSLDPYQSLLASLSAGQTSSGLGLPRAARLPVLSALQADLGRPLILVAARADLALAQYDELAFWVGSVRRHLFAEPNPLFYENAAWGATTRRERLQTLTALAAYHLPFADKPSVPPVIVTSPRGLMTRTLPRRDYLANSKQIRLGETYQPEKLVRAWVAMGYQAADTVLEPGQFSRRGGLLDLWTPAEPHPVRLDFFGDEVDTIRRFDPATQRTIDTLDLVLVTPAREFILPEGEPEDHRPDGGLSEFHIPLLHPFTSSLLDYLPRDTPLLIDDLGMLESAVSEIEEQAVKLRAESISEGILAEDFPVPYFSWSELNDALGGFPMTELGRSTVEVVGGQQPAGGAVSLADHFGQLERFAGRLKPFAEHLRGLVSSGQRVLVVSRQAGRLEELWTEQPVPESGSDNPEFIEASLSAGFSLDGIHLVTDSEIFGWERPQPRTRPRPSAETPEMVYADFNPGDWIVHVDYGVGRYAGLVQRTLEGLEREFLCVEYQKGDQVFVPIHQADRLTRYIGPDGNPPSPGHLGGQEWSEAKRRVREAVREVAQDLLDLYARRQLAEGYAFREDTPWQAELESSFPYVETEDQVRALVDIKCDMEAVRPMDRLLCGDVGYGKTELALRAAFKAVMDGKQVVLLVPTTVLAQQHFETFRQRLATFPVTVEMLSRFRTPREQDQIIYGLTTGAIDIVIGTHRLISSDVQLKDLGLVIIDEEQRFGVTHKERLKRLRTEVDVLTLTATPIPRTLYMALTGVRDISSLSTPPEERLPIVTHVGPYDPKLARQAILRELERGGQVFFVHNRVQTIDAMKMHLEKLIPEARVAVGHGQMNEAELALVMRRFTAGQIDVLLATSIIESGLDIPNANTLIVDRADAFGLAQLYQLRGRVGRGAMRAYAYFFRHRKLLPTPEGAERLDVIAENTQLGAGYSIAMRDLEMRGAGDLLGTRQSGHIAAVGFHLYTRLLAAAVRNLRHARGLPEAAAAGTLLTPAIGLPVNVDLPLASGIPEDYVPDQALRLRLYRRLADLTDEATLDALRVEFVDRFGPLPEMAENLFFQMRVKMRAEKAGLVGVAWESGQIILRYPSDPELRNGKRLPDLDPGVRGGKDAYWCTFGKEEDWPKRLLETLARLRK
ncbi:MAG: transcription-repair coupling factor [Anaerolineales bacterium]|nr:transcription-repair coupling factor [Anaerolineales bacterium]